MQQRPTKFCCCVYNPQLDTQCTTTVNHGGILKNAQKVHVKEEDSWMVGLCIRPDAKLHDGGFYVSCRSKKCTGGDFSRIKSSVRPQEVKYEAQNVEPPPPPYTPSPPTSDPPPCPPYLAYLGRTRVLRSTSASFARAGFVISKEQMNGTNFTIEPNR